MRKDFSKPLPLLLLISSLALCGPAVAGPDLPSPPKPPLPGDLPKPVKPGELPKVEDLPDPLGILDKDGHPHDHKAHKKLKKKIKKK